jgi:hypothetical protein
MIYRGLSMSEYKTRRIIPQIQVARVASRSANPSKMLEDALSIMDQQIERFRVKSGAMALDEREARTLLGYVKGLVEISKEEREREKSDKISKELENMSTDELLELAKKNLSK